MSRDRDRRPANRDPFPHMEMAAANAECAYTPDTFITGCRKCQMKVMLHCSRCTIQVTACMCVEQERHGGEEGFRRVAAQVGEQAARQRATQAGLWVPPQR